MSMKDFKEILLALMEHINVSAIVAVTLAGAAILCIAKGSDSTVTNNLISGLIGFIGGKVASR